MEPIIGPKPAENVIIDGSTESFMADVVEASKDTPVIVDFWATWCAPCKQLTPMLEKAVQAAGGAVRMVKIDIDQNQALAGQLRIQSVPTVMAFKDGQPVDGFAGALPESQIKAFIDRLTGDTGPSPIDAMIDAGHEALAAGDPNGALQAFGQAAQAAPDNLAALAGLAQSYVALGDLDQAENVLSLVPEGKREAAEIKSAQAAVSLAREAGEAAGNVTELEAKLAADADDLQARFDLALAAQAAGDRERAADELLEVFRRDQGWNDDAARKQLIKLFDAAGPTDPFTLTYRRRLSAMMFS